MKLRYHPPPNNDVSHGVSGPFLAKPGMALKAVLYS